MYFIKNNWELIKNDVMKVFDDLFSYGTFDRRINSSFIALISKCSRPICLSECKPICLVGFIYKILAKVLANRLRRVIREVVGDS